LNPPNSTKILLVTVAVLIAVIVALVAFNLSRNQGAHLTAAVTHSGIAFGGTVPLVLLTMSAAGLL
jgi:hypothetical protein